MEATFVIVGGGIAGVTCAETLAILDSNQSIILISESSVIKSVCNIYAITKTIIHFDVEEKEFSDLSNKYPNIKIICDTVVEVDNESCVIRTLSSLEIKYSFLCICTGGKPKMIPQASKFPNILGIRDTDSVEKFMDKLKYSKKIVIVGNGGIASELVYKIQNTEIIWAIKDKHISATFVDPGAAEFFQPSLGKTTAEKSSCKAQITKRIHYQDNPQKPGAALGPDWYNNFIISGANTEQLQKKIKVLYQVEIKDVILLENFNDDKSALEVTLTNNDKIVCDLIVSATGVVPRGIKSKNSFNLSEDGAIQVNEFMQTNLKNIYAAGDICNVNWPPAKHWFQMRLWTQARQMGAYAAKCMMGHLNKEEILQDFCFELFTHSTKLFGYKVILLGLYNGQKLGNDYEILLRMTKGKEYVKFVIQNHKLQGAILIGETDLEEMCENLILNGIDLEPYGDDILNPDIDIEDYFD